MKKIISVLLLAAMLISAAAGCAESAEKTENTPSVTVSETDEETEEEKEKLDLPDRNLDGFTVTFITKSTGAFASLDVGMEEETGDGYNDAVYKRDLTVEDKYNCKIECEFSPGSTPIADAKNTIKANDDYYDVIYDGLGNIFSLAMESLAIDINTLEYINFEKPWWDSETNETLSVNHKLYATYGEHMIGAKSGLYCLFFNKKLVSDLNLTEPYDLARDGTWTMDRFTEIAKTGNADIDGDGKMTGNDQYGHITEGYSGYTFMVACDWTIGSKDDDDFPTICNFDDNFYAKAAKVTEALGDKDVTNYVGSVPGVTDIWGAFWSGAFVNNQFLFREGAMHDSPNLRNMDSDFGIVPIPKYDEKQERYFATNSIMNAQMMCIPVSASTPDDVAFVIEAMAYYSVDILTPVYYNVVLQGKTFRDDDSEEMLDIIFASKRFDIGAAFDLGGVRDIVVSAVTNNTGKLASELAKKEKSIAREIEKIVKKFTEE